VTTHDSAPRSKIRAFSLGILLAFCLTVALGVTIVGGSVSPASAQGIALSECNNVGTVGGNTISCTITVVNNFTYNPGTPADPTGLATITTLIACTAPVVCGTTGTTTSVDPVTGITQCDTAGIGGASTVTCTATVTNNLTGYPVGAAIVPAVSQCQNPLLTTTVNCTAVPAGNTQAGSGGPGGQSETQCNSSGGAGGTMTCTATAPPSQSTGLPTTIDQCNGSGPTGASTVTCTVTIVNNFIASTAALPTPVYPVVTTSTSPSSTVPATVAASSTSSTVAATATTLTTLPKTTTTEHPKTTTTEHPKTTTTEHPKTTTTEHPKTTPTSSTTIATRPLTATTPPTTATSLRTATSSPTTATSSTTSPAFFSGPAVTSTTVVGTAVSSLTATTLPSTTVAAATTIATVLSSTTVPGNAVGSGTTTTTPLPVRSPGTGGLPPTGRNWPLILGLGLMLLVSIAATMSGWRRMAH
jgi:hypothetical protein